MKLRRRTKGEARRARVLRFVRRFPNRPSALDPLSQDERPDSAFEGIWHDGVKRRVIVVLALLACWASIVEAQLVHLQVFEHKAMLDRALNEEQEVIHPVGVRGAITDRDGKILAVSVPDVSIIATPKDIKDPAMTMTEICQALGDCTAADRAELFSTLATSKKFGVLRRADSVSPSQAERIGNLKLQGISLWPDTQRYYPNRELAGPVLGFVGRDNVGLSGLEFAYNEVIQGLPGTVRVLVDARKHGMTTRVDEAPTTGATIELTIDQYLQYITERELAAGVAAHHADGGAALIMDPNTGEILAMAQVPTFNPNAYESVPAEYRKNRVLQDVYEPGSTFKIVTASAALQEGVCSLADEFDTAPGYLQIGPVRIHDSEGHNNGVLSFVDVVVKSSNVGAGKIGLRVGPERLVRYVQRFGFGKVLLPDLPGQSAGKVYSVSQLNDNALAHMAIGYQVSVTPLQMATAVSAVANGGTLYEPHLVRALIHEDGEREDVAPKVIRQAINPETAATLTSILEQVVLRGTGTKAAVEGYSVAGKTGTAQKIVDHKYSQTDYNASFVGFVPSRKPVLTIIVVVDTPHGGSYFGGDNAAPIFSRIAEAALRHMRVLPTVATRSALTAPAPVPAPTPAPVPAPRPIVLSPDAAAGPRMPDLLGLTAREATRLLDDAGLQVRVTGAGVVTGQRPEAGDPIQAGGLTTLQLGRPAVLDTHAALSGGAKR